MDPALHAVLDGLAILLGADPCDVERWRFLALAFSTTFTVWLVSVLAGALWIAEATWKEGALSRAVVAAEATLLAVAGVLSAWRLAWPLLPG